MASLTHVCMWRDNHWERVTAEQASKIHPGGTVSAQSGLFMCELCGQYVTLTDGDVRIRYFKHNSAEKSKDCPERTFGPGVTVSYKPGEHELPLRIKNISADKYELEIGFVPIPDSLLTSDLKVTIILSGFQSGKYVYTRERFNQGRTTYLSVGSSLREAYSIRITGSDENKLSIYWPTVVEGIRREGSMFDAATGKRLANGADVSVKEKYLLVSRDPYVSLFKSNKHIFIRKIRSNAFLDANWFVYEVTANDFDESAARFFLDYHCLLTEKPAVLQPIWPVYVEDPYVIKHNQRETVFYTEGTSLIPHTFPHAYIDPESCGEGKELLRVNCYSRQQLISTGRSKVLQYTYYRKEPINQTTTRPFGKVIDASGEYVAPGETNTLPPDNRLKIFLTYDGVVIRQRKNRTKERQKLTADTTNWIEDIQRGDYIQLFVGMDLVWHITYLSQTHQNANEDDLLKELKSCSGQRISVPHAVSGMALYLKEYPKVRRWLQQVIADGWMYERSYRELQKFILTRKR